jgi:hypothetical protein
MIEELPPPAGDNEQLDFFFRKSIQLYSAAHDFSDNRMYIIPRWRGPDAQLNENFKRGWTIFKSQFHLRLGHSSLGSEHLIILNTHPIVHGDVSAD